MMCAERVLAALVVALAASGCVVVTAHRAAGNAYPPETGPARVVTLAPEGAEYLGYVELEDGAGLTLAELADTLAREAATLGADVAVIDRYCVVLQYVPSTTMRGANGTSVSSGGYYVGKPTVHARALRSRR